VSIRLDSGLEGLGELTSDAITADYRIVQRRRGHRLSLDDVATAWQAVNARADARRCLDLGCGAGSVLLMLAWKLRFATFVGVEALPMSAALARASIQRNGIAARASIIEGDLRELGELGSYDLITGTPPYLPPGTALVSPDAQRAAARIELRGGVEAYLLAAGRLLAPDGLAVVCADGRRPDRVIAGARAASLLPLVERQVFAHRGARSPLFSVWTLARAADRCGGDHSREQLIIRGEDGEQTRAARALRETFGL
jgi:tRNA1(Val) A37 N6-methylase TrmN6